MIMMEHAMDKRAGNLGKIAKGMDLLGWLLLLLLIVEVILVELLELLVLVLLWLLSS